MLSLRRGTTRSYSRKSTYSLSLLSDDLKRKRCHIQSQRPVSSDPGRRLGGLWRALIFFAMISYGLRGGPVDHPNDNWACPVIPSPATLGV